MFLGAREIYTYLRFEVRFEVWVGRGEEEEEKGKRVHGKDEIRSLFLFLFLSPLAML